MNRLTQLTALLAVIFFLACDNKKENNTDNTTQEPPELKGVEVALMDTSVNPCDDFYAYANGTWLKNTELPASKARYGSFNEVQDRNNQILKQILEDAMSKENAEKGSPDQMLGDFYSSALDMEKRNEQGLEYIQPEIEKINSIESVSDIFPVLGQLNLLGADPMFHFGVDIDLKNSTNFVFAVAQGGMGLPSPDMYQEGSPLKEKYAQHISNMLKLAGYENHEQMAGEIMEIETKLASEAMTPTERRNIDAQYNKFTLEEANEFAPAIDWEAYMSVLSVQVDTFLIAQLDFFKNLNSMLGSISLEKWKTYITWQFISSVSSKLTQEMFDEHFSFHGQAMRGMKEQKEPWEYALSSTERAIGHQLSKQFVKEHFTPETKARLNEAIDNVVAVLRERIGQLEWMEEGTKKEAYNKLDKLGRSIGYPEEGYWVDYTGLEISRDSYVRNFLNANEAGAKRELSRLGTKVDREDWFEMNPHMVNAFYNPSFNKIMFPAGILQPPFMDVSRDDAVLYGTIGAVIGHELTHGFDDMGKQFDALGNKRNWWTKKDSAAYAEQSKIFVDQYSKFEVLDSVFVNGELTLGENIADIGGLTIAFKAYQKSLEGKERKSIDGFTPEQRFFIGFGQVWRNIESDEEVTRRIKTDPHSPPRFRVLGTLANMDAFYEAFGCTEESKMYIPPEKRARMW